MKKLFALFLLAAMLLTSLSFSAFAEAYLRDIGLNEDEIAALRQNLSKDYGGIQ